VFCALPPLQCHEVVRSVAIDRAGTLLALGSDKGEVAVHDLSGGDLETPLWTATHKSKVVRDRTFRFSSFRDDDDGRVLCCVVSRKRTATRANEV
jgi:hypothetical protein